MFNQHRPTLAEINLANITSNFKTYQSMHSQKTLIPVVKANAYGHGAIEVVNALKSIGVSLFAVSLIEEAVELREFHDDIDILVMGPITFESFITAVKHNLIITLFEHEILEAALMSNLSIRCHVKFDSGMNRLGFKSIEETVELFKKAQQSSIIIEGIFTHFSTAELNNDYLKMQNKQFSDLIKVLPFKPAIIHASNTSALLKLERNNDFTTHARLGIGLYGLSLDDEKHHLKPAMVVKSKVAHLKHLKKGESVGYGATYTAQGNEMIAVIPIGYADGIIRSNKNGYVSINNRKFPIVGSICMDMIFVKVDKNVEKMDSVIIMGDKIVTIDDVAERLDTINYEVVCLISSRVPRHYIERQ